jgi:glyceraldehyde 3-phosphate dehydrogenase
MKRIAINGFGRIGRLIFRMLSEREDLVCVAINDLTDPLTLAHLLKYDSAHGVYSGAVRAVGDHLEAGARRVRVFHEKDPSTLPWQAMAIDMVLECTGVYTTREGMSLHLNAGAGKVLLSAPPKGGDVPSFVLGVNDEHLHDDLLLLSAASCTTNCLAPVIKVIHENFGIRYGQVTTTHAYTADQRLQDAPHRDLRRARAAGVNIVPTSTGAAKALATVYPPMAGRLDAMAFRVPVITGSLVDVNVLLERSVSRDAVNEAFRRAASAGMNGIIQFTEDPIVSSDVIGNTYSAIFDAGLTQVREDLLKVVAWYDNEAGYAARMIDIMALALR